MLRIWIRKNKTPFIIFIYILFFYLIYHFKPAFIYNEDGSLKEFGAGTRRKTIMPLWLCCIYLAVICYLMVVFYVKYPTLSM